MVFTQHLYSFLRDKLASSIPILLGCSGFFVWVCAVCSLLSTAVLVCMLVLQTICFIFFMFCVSRKIRKARGKYIGVFTAIGIGIAMSHGLGILMPEVGFDALWYHLPITQAVTLTHKFTYIPSLYQSALPSLGEMMFVPVFSFFGVTGVKVFVFLITCVFIYQVYLLARLYFQPRWAYLIALAVFTFQTISWQASSAYVDVIRAMFEVGAVLVLLYTRELETWKEVLITGLLLGFSLSTKMPAIYFLPAWIVLMTMKRSVQFCLQVCIVAFLLYLPWHVVSYLQTGVVMGVVASLKVSQDLVTHSNAATGVIYGIKQTVQLAIVPILATFHREGYLSGVYLFTFPFFLYALRKMYVIYKSELIFLAMSLWIWLLIPPLSVRYALMPLVLLFIVMTKSIWYIQINNALLRGCLLCTLSLSMVCNMMIRLGVNIRSLPYILGSKSMQSYISSFDSGILKGPLEKWYHIPSRRD